MPRLDDFEYFTLLDSNLVLINISEGFRNKYDFRDDRIKILTDTTLITKRLFHGSFFGDGSAVVSCFRREDIVRKIYQYDSFVPDDLRLFDIEDFGTVKVVDSTAFNKKQKK